MEHHPEGILMESDTYNALVKTIQRDCRVLESFKIMDYSLLLAIHNLDLAQREKLVSLLGTFVDWLFLLKRFLGKKIANESRTRAAGRRRRRRRSEQSVTPRGTRSREGGPDRSGRFEQEPFDQPTAIGRSLYGHGKYTGRVRTDRRGRRYTVSQ